MAALRADQVLATKAAVSAVVQVAAADVAAVPPAHSVVQVAHHVVVRSRSVRSVMSTRSYAHQT